MPRPAAAFMSDAAAADVSPSLHLVSAPADGQTGSGKTYTMLGSEEEDAGEAGGHGHGHHGAAGAAAAADARGLIQRVFEHLFARMAERGGKHLLECSFLEIYNEVRGWWGRVETGSIGCRAGFGGLARCLAG